MATLKIPAAYLEDFRSAVVAEVVNDSDMLRVNHETVLEGRSGGLTEDRTSAATAIHRAMALLDQVIDSVGEKTVEADGAELTYALERVVRLLAAHLDHEKGFGPINMGRVLELADELRWAAEEAIRLDPRLDEREAA